MGFKSLAARSGALPAALAALAAAAFGVAAATKPRSEVAAAYLGEARRAALAGDHVTAELCLKRLVNAPDPPPEAVWGLAETYEATGRAGRALPLWDRLAPPDRPGYAPAQLRRARALLRAPASGPVGARASAAAERHLRRALEADPDLVEARILLAHLLLATGRPGQAAPFLKQVADRRPELRMMAALAFAADGQPGLATRWAVLARGEASRALAESPDDFEARARLARALVFLGEHASAVSTLRDGLARTGDRRFRGLLSGAYAAWSDAEARAPSADPARPLLLLEEGLRVDPASGPLLERLGRVLKAGGPDADRVRRSLGDLLARGEGGAGAHFALGIDAWFRGDAGAARLHLEQAARLDPNGSAVTNNLAWVLSHGPDRDLSRALALSALALDRQPANPHYRGTRGSILVRLGRWKDALPDLEAALTANPSDPDLHHDLADAYDHLGLPELASAHRGRVAKPATGDR